MACLTGKYPLAKSLALEVLEEYLGR